MHGGTVAVREGGGHATRLERHPPVVWRVEHVRDARGCVHVA